MEIQIDNSGLSAIYGADQVVTLARYVDQAVDAVAAQPTIAWQAFAPLQLNAVNWADQYYCFATTTPLIVGAVVTMNSQSGLPLQIGLVYQFTQGQFVKQQAQTASSYITANMAPSGSYAFGLAQSATVNNVPTLAPFCAVPVLYNQAAYFNPSDAIAIFLSSAKRGGTVLPPPSNALKVVANGAASAPTIGFDGQNNTFYQIS